MDTVDELKQEFLKQLDSIKKIEGLKEEIEKDKNFDKTKEFSSSIEEFEKSSQKWLKLFKNFQKKITDLDIVEIEDHKDEPTKEFINIKENGNKNQENEEKEKDEKIQKLQKRVLELENQLKNLNKVETKEDKAATVIQKYWRKKIILKKWKFVVINFCTSKEAKKLGERNKIIKEILQTERTYVRALTDMKNMYLIPLKKLISDDEKFPITSVDIERMFMNVEQLQMIHYVLLQELEKKVEGWPKIYLGETFFNHVS